jgi:uncharacterized lipoprotein YddW (UPF0748 family)
MIIDTVVSHGDWFNAWGSYGRPSVYRILDQCREAGIRKVYWRSFLGARAHYHSRLEPVAYGAEGIERPGFEAGPRRAYDLREWDPLRDAVEVAHELGLKLSAWSTFYEETHVQLATTRFAEQHPEYAWVARDGRQRRSKLSFAYPEVREYKRALLLEQADYGVDDLCLDFFRENQTYQERHERLTPKQEVDLNGVCLYGYEPAMVEAFQQAFGVDPHTLDNADERWIRFRAGFLTQFLRELRPELQRRGITLSAKVRSMELIQAPFPYWEPEAAPTNSLRGSFVDWPTWVSEGLLDEVMVIHEHFDLTALDLMKLFRETRAARALVGGRTKLMMGLWCYNLHDAPVAEGKRMLELGVNAAVQAGADGIVLWESTPIHGWGSAIGGGGGVDIGLWSKVQQLAQASIPQILT